MPFFVITKPTCSCMIWKLTWNSKKLQKVTKFSAWAAHKNFAVLVCGHPVLFIILFNSNKCNVNEQRDHSINTPRTIFDLLQNLILVEPHREVLLSWNLVRTWLFCLYEHTKKSDFGEDGSWELNAKIPLITGASLCHKEGGNIKRWRGGQKLLPLRLKRMFGIHCQTKRDLGFNLSTL